MSNPISTALYIGGKVRQTAEKMAVADPAKPGVIVGHAAAATTQDVSDAVAAAKAALSGLGRPFPRSSAPRRCWPRSKALLKIGMRTPPSSRRRTARFALRRGLIPWFWSCAGRLALSHTDEVQRGQGAATHPRRDSGANHRRLPAAGCGHHHRAIQLAGCHPGRCTPACAAGRQYGHCETAADDSAGYGPHRPAHCRTAAARRTQRRHGCGCQYERTDPQYRCGESVFSQARSMAARR